MKIKLLKINIGMGQYEEGSIQKIKCTDDGTPINTFWRRRLRDAKVDSCVEWYRPEVKQETKSEVKQVSKPKVKKGDSK